MNTVKHTSCFGALLYTVLGNMQGKEHVRIPAVLFLAVRSAGAACCQCCIQEESRLLCRVRP